MLKSNSCETESYRPFSIYFLILAGFFAFLSVSHCGKPRGPSTTPPTTSPTVSSPGDVPDDPVTFPEPEIELRIDPSVIQPGDSSLLIWETQNAQKVTIEPAVGTVDTSGRIRLFPDQTTTYFVEAAGRGGSTTSSVTVEVMIPGVSRDVREEDLADLPLEERFKIMVKPVFFGFDSARLTDEAKAVLDENIQWLSLLGNQSIQFVIEGHADERGSEEYNLALGDQRAQVVADYLIRNGIDRSRITTVSLGEERPFDTRKIEAAYTLNRRAQFVLLRTP